MKAIAAVFCGLMFFASCSGCITAEKKGDRKVLEGVTRNRNEARLTWDAPTTNTDGSPLTDLAGYNIYSGQTHNGPYGREKELRLGDPGLDCIDINNENGRKIRTECTYTLTGFSDDTHYFAVTAFNAARTESGYSNKVRK